MLSIAGYPVNLECTACVVQFQVKKHPTRADDGHDPDVDGQDVIMMTWYWWWS